jgi:hypothetical protein
MSRNQSVLQFVVHALRWMFSEFLIVTLVVLGLMWFISRAGVPSY